MSARKELEALEVAEIAYLAASGWVVREGLWRDPLSRHRGHIDRVAAYKQRQRDTAEENAKEAAMAKP